MEKKYYHMFANGDDSRNFITSEFEFKVAFNRMAVCCHLSGATVVSASVEDSHPHALLWGTYSQCFDFKTKYEQLSIRCITQKRGSVDDVILHCEIYPIEDDLYLKRVACYTIVQATKDGKKVMPYDYKYGTGALYFRSPNTILPWLIDEKGNVCTPARMDEIPRDLRNKICGTKETLPGNWMVCNGFVMPSSYVDVARFEGIYVTHNCYRTFLCSGKGKDESIYQKMYSVRGINIEDLEARRICIEICQKLFNRVSTRMLNNTERLQLAQEMRSNYHLSYRQISFLVKIPESELRLFIV